MFANWFRNKIQQAEDPHNILSELCTYYSAAFEFIALGAAKRE